MRRRIDQDWGRHWSRGVSAQWDYRGGEADRKVMASSEWGEEEDIYREVWGCETSVRSASETHQRLQKGWVSQVGDLFKLTWEWLCSRKKYEWRGSPYHLYLDEVCLSVLPLHWFVPLGKEASDVWRRGVLGGNSESGREVEDSKSWRERCLCEAEWGFQERSSGLQNSGSSSQVK